MEFNQQLYKKRQRSNAIGLTLSLGAMALGLFVLLWILSVLLSNGFAALDWNMFTQSTPCLLYTSPSPRDVEESRMPSSA